MGLVDFERVDLSLIFGEIVVGTVGDRLASSSYAFAISIDDSRQVEISKLRYQSDRYFLRELVLICSVGYVAIVVVDRFSVCHVLLLLMVAK